MGPGTRTGTIAAQHATNSAQLFGPKFTPEFGQGILRCLWMIVTVSAVWELDVKSFDTLIS